LLIVNDCFEGARLEKGKSSRPICQG